MANSAHAGSKTANLARPEDKVPAFGASFRQHGLRLPAPRQPPFVSLRYGEFPRARLSVVIDADEPAGLQRVLEINPGRAALWNKLRFRGNDYRVSRQQDRVRLQCVLPLTESIEFQDPVSVDARSKRVFRCAVSIVCVGMVHLEPLFVTASDVIRCCAG